MQQTEPSSPVNVKQSQVLEKIRPELNLEKWSLWKPSKSTSPPEVKTLEREITLPDGSKVKAKVRVDFTSRGELTTEDQKTYYALIKYWEVNGRSEQQTFFSINQLAKFLKKRGWGTNVIESLTQSLMRLRGTLIIWENSYYDSTTRETIELLDTFNILSELRIVKKKTNGTVNKAVGYFKFNDFIIKNLRANHTKPLLLDTFLSFNSEIAQLLYTHLDLIMADKYHYERRSKELFHDLGLHGKAYNNLSDRKRKLDKALQELQGKLLTTGIITKAALEETVDGKDYKIVMQKGKLPPVKNISGNDEAQEPPTAKREELTLTRPEPVAVAPTKDALVDQGETLVKHFYKIFYKIDKSYPKSSEVAQAITLIANHGYEQATHIINFAYKAAPETGFKIATFGGILQYTTRAVSEYETKKHQKELRAQNAVCPLCNGKGFVGIQHPQEANDRATRCQHKQEWLDAWLLKNNASRTW